jgi:hypothetical protein
MILGHYPIAVSPLPPDTRLVQAKCQHCGSISGVSKWVRWRGFLTRCPNCGYLIGEPWHFSDIVWLSMLLNVASVFFTLRPHVAGLLVSSWLWLNLQVDVRGDLEGVGRATYFATVLLAPLVVNVVIHRIHQTDLHRGGAAVVSEAK